MNNDIVQYACDLEDKICNLNGEIKRLKDRLTDIDIFSKYKINEYGNYSNLDEDNRSKYDNSFTNYEYHNEYTYLGYELIDKIARCLKDDTICSFGIRDNIFKFEYFNGNNGESETKYLKIERIKDDKLYL